MSIYTSLKTTADRLIAKYGVSYTFTNTAKGARDSNGQPSEVVTTYDVIGVIDNYSIIERTNESIRTGDVKMIATYASFLIGDTVIIDTIKYRVVNVLPIKPGAVGVAQQLQLRR